MVNISTTWKIICEVDKFHYIVTGTTSVHPEPSPWNCSNWKAISREMDDALIWLELPATVDLATIFCDLKNSMGNVEATRGSVGVGITWKRCYVQDRKRDKNRIAEQPDANGTHRPSLQFNPEQKKMCRMQRRKFLMPIISNSFFFFS